MPVWLFLLVVAVGALLIAPSVPVELGGAGASASAVSIGQADISHSAGSKTETPSPVAAAALSAPMLPSASAPQPELSCPEVVDDWLAYYSTGILPPVVTGTDTPNCVPGPDDVGLSLLSNQTFSGSRPEVTIGLPTTASYDAGSLQAFWVGVAVSGVPCSLDAQSMLRIEFIPPTQSAGNGPASDWQVRAPVWDLVTPGSCDPQCQNASALFTIGGARFCEDDAVIYGSNSRRGAPDAYLLSGDAARIEIGGGNGAPLTVYLNDTVHVGQSASWQYPGQFLASGDPIEPYNANASSSNGWTFGGAVSVGWTSCPVLNASSQGVPCNSYGGDALASDSYPRLSNSSFWNPSAHAYNAPYSQFSTWSSSGACSGLLGVSACTNFVASGGEGAYPSLSIHASDGQAWVGYGSNASGLVAPIASAGSGFASNGASTGVDPSVITGVTANYTPTSILLSARATDPRGIARVLFGGLWCFDSSSLVPSFFELSGSEGIGPDNGPENGTFFASLPRGSNTTGGTFFYAIDVFDSLTGPGAPPFFGAMPIPSVGMLCGIPNGPAPTVLSATPLSNGYQVDWSYPGLDSEMVRNFSVLAQPAAGGPPVAVSVPNPLARTVDIALIAGVAYEISVAATVLDGATFGSAETDALATLPPFSLNATESAPSLWEPNAVENVSAIVLGGAPPYCLTVAWGDGTNSTACRPTSSIIVSHDYDRYCGLARLRVVANDSDGDSASAPPRFIDVRATPLGVAVTVRAGDGIVDINWTAPPSPSGPVTGYVVYFTSDPVGAQDLTEAWPSPINGPHPVFLRNTTSRTLDDLPVLDGSTVYVEVVAWDSYGAGLVNASGPSTGMPEPLTVAFTPPPSGGPAPYPVHLNATVTSGSPNAIENATFFVTGGPTTNGSVTTDGPVSWVTGNLTIGQPGNYSITVHVVDALVESAAATTTVYVGTGAAPLVSLSVLTPTPFSGGTVAFAASVTQGTGPYGYSWVFGDGTTALDAGPLPLHSYDHSGETTVSVSVTDNSTGATTTVDRTFVIYALPMVSIVASTGGSGGLSFAFQAIVTGGSGPATVNWSFGDGATSTGPNASHAYSQAGTYSVHVSATDPTGLKATSSVMVYAGLAKSTVPFLGGGTGVALLIGVVVLAVLLAVTTLYYHGRYRRVQVLEGERVAEKMYGGEARPAPPELPEPRPAEPEESDGPDTPS